MEEKILDSIKRLLGIEADDPSFDEELIMHINSVFFVLNQLGVGPTDCFSIDSSDDAWLDFTSTQLDLEAVRTYTYLKVRLLFDPPQNSFLINSIEKLITEFEWRLQVQAEPYLLTAEEAQTEEDEEI